ncbi:LPS export ABC transporter protein LptC [Pseudarcicella hirudinis]|uniref:LPS export ABC transporter protein LptC n=1 Tax=Pseudarcicella hirudinis TaxID=1079859 RepID=A0A1I5VXL1_9BACT|nr:LPS export ABC transporter periplasmic protein LptC [Pseudarcicella hirudinis]SFQ12229.1 LPS export ABC transporter protein LptC [Pseudarcicella hirudinis]
MKNLFFFIIFLGITFLQVSCKEENHKKKIQLYEGPLSELDGINMTYSDSARLIVRMVTEKQLTMPNDDRVYPKEVKIFFYDRLGNETTNLRGDSARYFRSSNLYKVYRHVVINNTLKGETLKTDELIWNPDQKRVYTDKPVDVYTREEVLHGIGMDANQDFTQYTLRRVTGVVSVKNLPQ